jgi:uncharacterized protein YukE
MIDPKLLDDLAKRLAGSVPTGLQFLQALERQVAELEKANQNR